MRNIVRALLAERAELAGMLADLGYLHVAHSAQQLAISSLSSHRAQSIREARAKQGRARLRAWGWL